jgi:uncharacterized membrane protein YwaF
MEITLHLCEYFSIPLHDFLRSLIHLELCAITLWMAFALRLTKREAVFEILYFWRPGALASLVFANDGGAGPDRFRDYQYLGTHGYTIWPRAAKISASLPAVKKADSARVPRGRQTLRRFRRGPRALRTSP